MLSFLLTFLLAQPASALVFKVIGQDGQVLLHTEQDVALPTTVGQATVQVLDGAGAEYQGDASGIASIAGLGSKLEVISDQEFKAYGWCFSLNGVAPDVMPDQAQVLNQDAHIVWYYAFARMKNGEWVSQCEVD